MKKRIFPLLTLMILFVPGALAHAANLPLLDPNFSIVPEACRVDCPCGVGAALQFIQNIMNVLISFAVVVMSLIIAWAGFLFVMSAANPESRSKARSMLINAFIGLAIVLSAWLIVDFIMKHLYSESTKTSFGPWNKILVLDGSQCIEKVDVSGIAGLPGLIGVAVNPAGTGSDASGGGATSIPVGDIQQRVCTAAGQYTGHSTAACNCGRLACAWAVNQVFQIAGVSQMGGSSVQAMRSALNGGRGKLISKNSAVCGDLVMVTSSGANHVGICLNSGCTSVISNSSTNHSFSWPSSTNPPFVPDYSASIPREYYRVTN